MPNRGQTQDQRQKDRKNPATLPPDDDEVQPGDPTQLGAEQRRGRKRRDLDEVEDQPTIEQEDEEAEDDEDDDDGIGARP